MPELSRQTMPYGRSARSCRKVTPHALSPVDGLDHLGIRGWLGVMVRSGWSHAPAYENAGSARLRRGCVSRFITHISLARLTALETSVQASWTANDLAARSEGGGLGAVHHWCIGVEVADLSAGSMSDVRMAGQLAEA